MARGCAFPSAFPASKFGVFLWGPQIPGFFKRLKFFFFRTFRAKIWDRGRRDCAILIRPFTYVKTPFLQRPRRPYHTTSPHRGPPPPFPNLNPPQTFPALLSYPLLQSADSTSALHFPHRFDMVLVWVTARPFNPRSSFHARPPLLSLLSPRRRVND